jgi:hypothetical protein
MATRTVVCPECAEPVPYGRLACPSCGALLASVAGVARRTEPVAAPEPSEEPLLEPDDEDASPERPMADTSLPDEPELPEVPELEPPRVVAAPSPQAWPVPADVSSVLHDWTEPGSDDEREPRAGTAPAGDDRDEAPDLDAAADRAIDTDAGEPYQPAGAYMPPSAVFAAETAMAGSAATPAPGGGATPNASKPRRPGDAPLLADLPFDAPDDLPGWLVASGAAIGTIGFFLPWAHRVIGSSGDGYFSGWGFGALMNVPIFVAVLLALVLVVVPNRVPAWLRSGVLPLVVGGLLIGVAWPYVLYGPLAGRFGSLLEAFAGLLLVAGGILALRARRHVGPPPTV